LSKASKNRIKYPFVIRSLSAKEGGGFLIKFPDLPGCISDGESIGEAINMGKKAVKAWISTAKKMNLVIPKPSS